jgi:hypothetical protein
MLGHAASLRQPPPSRHSLIADHGLMLRTWKLFLTTVAASLVYFGLVLNLIPLIAHIRAEKLMTEPQFGAALRSVSQQHLLAGRWTLLTRR